MWTCPKCKRVFGRVHQSHSCSSIPLEDHFKNKVLAKELFGFLLSQINTKVGKCKIILIPCCVHLFGTYDFFAALPKQDGLEIRFALNRKLDSKRLKQCVKVSTKAYKNCLDVKSKSEIDTELLAWIKEAHDLKN